MGRTLEALKRTTPASVKPVPEIVPARPAEEVPFIEVGGPNRTIEASAAVMKYMSAAASVVASKKEPVQQAPERGISFQTLPESGPALSPARDRLVGDLVAYHRPNHRVSEEYRGLLSGIIGQLPLAGSQVLLLAGLSSGVGTSTVALNLAITRAMQAPGRVVAVDGNCRRPALADYLGLPRAPGLRDVLAGSVPLARAVRETGVPQLFALAAGEPSGAFGHPPDVLRSLLAHLRRQFEFVLVDGPSWEGGPESAALAGGCDAVYLVLRGDEVGTPRMNELVRLMPQLGSHVGGCIVTQGKGLSA
jgi:Mrp family chromosome partitioning ATPase